MNNEQRARCERFVQRWINGEFPSPHDAVAALIEFELHAEARVLEELTDDLRSRVMGICLRIG